MEDSESNSRNRQNANNAEGSVPGLGTAMSSATTLALPSLLPQSASNPRPESSNTSLTDPRRQGGESNDEPGEIENIYDGDCSSGGSGGEKKNGRDVALDKANGKLFKDVEGGVQPAQAEPPQPPPDGGYGWVCVACVFAVNACTWGLNSAYGIYLAYYLSTRIHPSATPYHYAFIGGLSISVSMTVGPVVAFLYRRGFTTQHIMLMGIIFQTASLLGASWAVTSLVGLFLTQGVLFGLGLGFLFTSSIGTISQWFSQKRSVANGISAAGSGVGGLCFAIGLNKAIENVGVAWSFRITAIVVTVVNLIATSLIRDRNAHVKPNHHSFDIGLIKRLPNFGLVLFWGFFSLLGYVVILFSMADYSRSIGLSASQGSIVAAMLSVGMTFGRPCVGFLSDIYGRINISAFMTFLSAITVFALWMPSGNAGFGLCIIFALLNGAVCGTFWTTISPVTTEIVGLKELPSALSIVWLSTVLPTTFSEAIALALRRPELVGQSEGGFKGVAYLYPQVWSGVMYLLASLVMWILRARLVGAVIQKEEEEAAEIAGSSLEKETGLSLEKEGGGGVGNFEDNSVMARWRRGGKWWRWAKV